MPWNRTVIGLAIINFLLGFGGDGIITGGNVWVLHIWGKSNGPFIRMLSFSCGIRTFIAPLIAEHFFGTILKYCYL
jgi:hypothetical protein